METNKVWIVSAGEQGKGGDVVGVYASQDLAVKAALDTKTYFEGGWTAEGEGRYGLYWTNGCDFVTVREWAVKTA